MTRLGRFSRSRGGLVTLGIVVALLIALGATVLGVGARDHALASSNASAWLYSSNRGEIARVNAETGRVDTRFKVVDAQGHAIQVSQSDRYLVLRDLTTGKVSSLDLATLQIAATTQTTAGLGVTLALDRDAAFVVDAVQGVVRQLDPVSLTPIGEPLRFPPGVSGGIFDGTGTLWLLVASEGTVVGITPAPAHASQGTASGPTKARTIPVAPPDHDLSMSTLADGVAVLDSTATTLTLVQGDKPRSVPLPQLSGNGSLPAQSTADAVPVTVLDNRHVYVVSGARVADVAVPGTGALSPAVPFAGKVYVADEAAGTVYEIDGSGKVTDTIVIPNAGGKLEVQVRGGHLFINAPNSSAARVVDDRGRVKTVDKYANNILGGDPPPNPPPPPPQKPPTVGPPSAPARVVATAGNASAHVTWGPADPNGSPVTKYVVEGDGQVHEVGANQRALDVAGLTNGQQYVFTVYAVNAKGAGPKKSANPVVPTSAVPDPPASVTATANKDGTVTITYPAANGQGRPVIRYDITQVSAGAQAPLTSVTGTTATVPAGQLTYGTQYAFLVAAVNNLGTASKPSPVSNTVVPFTVPGTPVRLNAVPIDAKGQISLVWQPAANNGRPVTGYQVTAGGTTVQPPVTGTSVTIGGFPDASPVNVTVRAINDAGPGAPASTVAHTIGPPILTGGGAGVDPNNKDNGINVSFTTNPNGGRTACTISINGGGATGIGCNGGAIGGLWPGATYNFTVNATNNAGGAKPFTGSVAIPAVTGTVICTYNDGYCNSGIWAYRVASQANDRDAIEALPVGRTFQALCRTTGGNVNAYQWTKKNNNLWIVFAGIKGREYFPDAWTTLSSKGDNINVLPPC